ncbi:MAG: response regulator transcription factor [Planctomycetes bacterium]|nr:response regulator transcription factor [Planctomycetota bacterium]MBI3836276.1 response regulator transcription factor [Planctomycetota bacterium]
MISKPTVFVVDDDEGVRRALRRLIELERVGVETFTSAKEFLEHFDAGRPGCVVLDVRMPELSGLELQEQLTARGVRIPIIFMTAHGDVPMGVQAMKSGAVDFITKPFSEQTLLEAIHKAIAVDAAMRLEQSDRNVILVRIARLTRREHQVFRLVAAGRLNKQIALELGTSEKTIKVHRGRVMQKLEAESLADLVLQAQTVGLVGIGTKGGPQLIESPPRANNPH